MPLPPSALEDRPDPLSATIVPIEGTRHPAYGEVPAWIDRAMAEAPSAGPLGLAELLRHWNALPAEGRKRLLVTARTLVREEQTA